MKPGDEVGIALRDIHTGEAPSPFPGSATKDIPIGRKVSLRALAMGEPIHRLGQRIGIARTPIACGAHVRIHNPGYEASMAERAVGTRLSSATMLALSARSTFDGIPRANGKVATRDDVGVLTSVNCSALVARIIADHFRDPCRLALCPDVDDVVALTHKSGCSVADGPISMSMLRRTRGTAILAETPEIYGAENLLPERAISSDVGQHLIGLLDRWEDYTRNEPQGFDNNPSPGNMAGGLAAILEKSLGAVAKGGTTNLVESHGTARPVNKRGLVLVDPPGFDPISATGQVAGGTNLIAFTTGRGSCFGCHPVPSIKLATDTAMFTRMAEDMDINCGTIPDGEQSIKDVGAIIFQEMIATASDKRTKSKEPGYGDDEFASWHVNAWLQEAQMPMIRVELLKGRTVDQKREFALVVTREAARILSCRPEVVDIVFQDVEPHDWANGGRLSVDK